MQTKQFFIGDIRIGGDSPVTVQTMWKDPLPTREGDLRKVALELSRLKAIGCAFVRFAVPDEEAAGVLVELSKIANLPLVADIHFDYRLALRCIEGGVRKIRINPGNIGAEWKVREVIRGASDHNIPIRVGVNSGSLPKKLQKEPDTGAAMLRAAEEELEIFERLGFSALVFSLKASDINTTVKANELFAEKHPYPLHLGVTEAGPLIPGIVKSSVAMARLLGKGIGHTIRVSLSDSPLNEVIAGMEILGAAGLRQSRPQIISCPRCGRASFDTHSFVKKISPVLYALEKEITVAIMGCVVNGPGEAKHADLGITGAGKEIILFKHGKILRRVAADDAYDA
ncbi:MAG: flavodoxin-dependent (E)-4-hydroxy-3-methylbut-2-enyl-diphosphate synthase, partial [Spirochaetales bacterium]|nr:flavodoxin-dependent (E)-4-hydroxy-3-methylbut-2-enyl-diphosphate synthase [Spirochaetales bacterium]